MGNKPSLTDEAKDARWRAMFEGFAFSDVSNIDVAQIDAWGASGRDQVVLIDCRDQAEQRVSMVPAAVTKGAFMEQLRGGWRAAADTTTHLVCYCTIGYRSSYAARALAADADLRQQLAAAPSPTTAEGSAREQAPRVRVHNLRGGVLAWAHAQREFLTVAPAGGNDGNDGGDGEDRGGVSRTRALHVYGRRWDLAPSNYETTWYTMLGWT